MLLAQKVAGVKSLAGIASRRGPRPILAGVAAPSRRVLTTAPRLSCTGPLLQSGPRAAAKGAGTGAEAGAVVTLAPRAAIGEAAAGGIVALAPAGQVGEEPAGTAASAPAGQVEVEGAAGTVASVPADQVEVEEAGGIAASVPAGRVEVVEAAGTAAPVPADQVEGTALLPPHSPRVHTAGASAVPT
ncbi:MAG: hypothetical protein AUI53_05950 [Acidobacteria bacterium 13_1_40CM_2_60_7]|nr:MAG: hypothetical protein AUI53_05950 [Acidobacteria bacterium 13_1_40CM_2_60_7]